ncbi:MAG: Hsp70 family protein [Pirellulales bacterium]
MTEILGPLGVGFLKSALESAARQPADELRDNGRFCASVVTEAWKAAPLRLRLQDPAEIGWNGFMLAVRDVAFDLAGATPRLLPDWEARLLAELAVAGDASMARPAGIPVAMDDDDDDEEPVSDAPPLAAAQTGAVAPPASTEPVIGIDLGTTYSVVAHLDSQGRPTSIANSAGEMLTPSVVLFDPDGTVVGKQALLGAAMEPDRVADCVKRDMGSKHYRRPINGELLPPEVISSYILRSVRADAERKLGPVKKAVITVPAYFDEPRRRATVAAGRLAGLEVLDTINEPTAAAISFGYQQGFLDRDGRMSGERPIRVLVYDLGGGTFDVTLVELSSLQFTALATDGDVQLGGKDWDEKLIEIAAARFQQQHGDDPRQDAESLQELWQAAELAKKTLTERQKAVMFVNCGGRRLKTEITRQEFEEATAALLERTRMTTEIVVLQQGLAWEEIDKVLLVGGSTRMPRVAAMLRELTGRDADQSVSADEAVAHGAALYANLLAQKMGSGEQAAEFSVTNVNSHSLGVVGMEAKTGRRVNAVIIAKNSPLPRSAGRRFKTAKLGQASIRVTVLEGESEVPEACTEVGTCLVRNLPPNLPAGWPIDVRFQYRENGQLEVSAQLSGHDAVVTTEFVRDNSLTDDDLMLWAESLEREAERNAL